MQLRETEEMWQRILNVVALEPSILEAVPEALIGLQNRRIIFANKAVKDIFGWDREELIGQSVTIFYRNTKESREVARVFYHTLCHQSTLVHEFFCRRKDGAVILCRLRAARIGKALIKKRIIITYADITEMKTAEEELQRSYERLRDLSHHLETLREKESARIAREIHDDLGQSLTALKMDITWLESQLPLVCTTMREKTWKMSTLVDAGMDSVHRIIMELRPILLDDLGLIAAIEWQVQEFQDRYGIKCHLCVDCQDHPVNKELATSLFRIVQETLTNAARHAEATNVWVRFTLEGDELCLDVVDDGKGISRKQIDDPKSFGILGIRERVSLWNGRILVSGKRNRGTAVSIRIPILGRQES